MPGQPVRSCFPTFGSGRGFPGLPAHDWGGIKHQLPLKSSGFASVGLFWALTVAVVAGDAKRPRLLASALALVQLHPAGAAFHGLSRCASSPALIPAHVRPIKADKHEEKTMTPIDFALLINAAARLLAALAKFVTAIRQKPK